MARKISVQNSREHLKKSVALLLVRRMLACGIYDAAGRLVAIRRLAIRELPCEALRDRIPVEPRAYIPEKMPPSELPNTRFQPPQSDLAKLQRAQVGVEHLVRI